MLDKMISVSPPQKGEALDSKLADSKIFREVLKSDYKRDFAKALEAKLDQRKNDLADSKKEATRRAEELRVDKKEKKSPGGIKKKVNEDDDKTVSNVMASNENKVETPVSKKENLAAVKVETSEKSAVKVESDLKASKPMDQLLESQQMDPSLVKDLNTASLEGQSAASLEAELANQQQQSNALANAAIGVDAEAQLKAAHSAAELKAELESAVGFTTDSVMQQTNKDLLDKMKAFDVDKSLTSSKQQSFEQSVLSRLHNEQLLGTKNTSTEDQSGDSKTDFGQQGSEQLRDFKSELMSSNQLHQAAGQTQNEFKTHLASPSLVQDQSLAKLEENREANVNEIMNQAQYLVKKGGGEVSVKMNPDGLGEVHLKVLLQDGKLNIELQTHNKDVKKMIEDSLSELKSGLSAHRVSLENFKVDNVSATNTENNTQFQSNSQSHSEGRQREFWSGFQGNMNNQSGRKSSYLDAGGRSSASSNSSVSGFSANSTQQGIRTYGGTKGATINRVA